MKKFLFDRFPHLLHGADYNPEQWLHDRGVWDEDMRLLKLANCNELSVGIFSWAKLEPREGEYDFSFLDEIIEKIGQNGGKVILATPSGARPRWMAEKYPEVLRVLPDGTREHFRARHNHCYTSPVYREKVRAINRELALRYGHNDTVIGWHVSNEYGGECHCELCQQAFREYLREKFGGNIEKLNLAYWTTFWSHTYDSFDQIEAPGPRTETGIHGLNLDWRRFVTAQTRSFIENETAPLKELSDLPTTINMMWDFGELDYHAIAPAIDIASWDAYPEWHNGPEPATANATAFWHDFYRSLKDQPFLLMESTPSLVNWKPINKLKAPGLDTLSSLQAVFHGSDSVQYFQWRKGRGSSEKFHGAVVDHDGSEDHRVFRSVARTGAVLKKLDGLTGSRVESRVAILYDWNNRWALEDAQGYQKDDKKYSQTCYEYHRYFWERGINCDVVSPKADLSRYSVVVAPMLYLVDAETARNLTEFVRRGGALYGTYMMATVDENDLCYLGGIPGAGLRQVFGVKAEEIDTLYPEERRHAGGHEVMDYCEILKIEGAQVLQTYDDGWYKGLPAVTVHPFGKGLAVYQACRDTGSLKDRVLDSLLETLGLEGALPYLPEGVTAHSRTDGETTWVFVENYTDSPKALDLGAAMENALTGETESACALEPFGFRVYTK